MLYVTLQFYSTDDIVYVHNRNSPSILASVELVDVATAPAVTQFVTNYLNM